MGTVNNIDEQWFLDQIKMEAYPRRSIGGQVLNNVSGGIILKCPETSFEVICQHSRSMIENRDACLEIYKIYLKKYKWIRE